MVKECEALALLDAITWVADLGFERVIFETDAKLVVDAIRSWDTDFTEFGSIIAKCWAFLHQGNSYSVSYVRRQANEAGHVLAQESRFLFVLLLLLICRIIYILL
ncbi:hypothetical protein PTKIN_Ptkin19aG0062900 [Pterospermum kingtungense]